MNILKNNKTNIMWFNIKNWQLNKIFEFKNFMEAISFINKVADIAENMNHHPDIKIFDYKYVEINIFTHSEAKITENDYKLAELIDNLI